ncbi:Ubiquinone biosynthesis O-methyltransferase, mitochondrial [Sporomusa carbonis]|uniref:methyltransferase domain-containing protein n=1 Tax=Sporomusa carbonis TaxID=3076075 RepID=UPI003A695B79
MKTTIVILTYNQVEYTKKCIESIRNYTEPGTYEIIIVDNCSTDGTINWLSGQHDLQVIYNEQNLGLLKGRNQGIEIASGDTVLLLNNDVIVTHGWLNNLMDCLYSNEKIGAVGALTNNCSNSQDLWVAYRNMEEMQEFAQKHNQSTPRVWEEKLKLVGFCLLIRKEVVDQVGLFDEVFTPGGFEDDDYSFRIRLAGYKLMLCKNTFVHNFGSQPFRTNESLKNNRDQFIAKWGFDPVYSTSVRYDLIHLIDKPKDCSFTVLDIGCACGGTLLQIKNQYNNAEIFGIELNKKAAVSAQLFADVIDADIEKTTLPYPEEYFDYIIFGDVLEHLQNPWQVLENVKPYLKADGYLLTGIPNVMHFSVLRNLLQGSWTYEDAGILDKTHLRFFTLNEIDKMFKNAGYVVEDYKPGIIYESENDKKFIQELAALAGRPQLAEQYRAYNYRMKAYKATGANSSCPHKTRFVTIFPETENVHLIKDVGMIPYTLYKNFGYDASIVTYENGTYPYLDAEVKGLKLEYLSRIHNEATQDVVEYLRKNGRNIDILHVFHWIARTLTWIDVYKEVNPNGRVYLKLDANEYIKNIDIASVEGTRIFRTLKKCDLISVETQHLYNYLNDRWPLRIEYIPNGFYETHEYQVEYRQKENVILTVGRIGEFAKANEVLLEAFKQAHTRMANWKLKLVGPVMPGFQEVIDNYFDRNPELRDKVLFTGEIIDRETLEGEYRKAKIFCLTSRWESFGIVLAEAAKNGCYLITSNVISAMDLTDNGQYGCIFAIDNAHQLALLLIAASQNEEMLKANCQAVQKFAREKFHWGSICQRIYDGLSNPTPNENIEIAEIRNIIDPTVDQAFVDRLDTYPVALKMAFWENHCEYLAVRECRELEGVLLDFGCGSGHMDILLAREGRTVCGIDLSPNGIAIANYFRSKESLEVQKRVSFLVADITKPRTDKMRFDCVWAADVFQYISDPEQIFRSLRNWVKGGACMLISVHPRHAYYDPRHVQFFNDAEELKVFLNKYISVLRVDTDNKHNVLRALCKF